jgi:hypothetical protein
MISVGHISICSSACTHWNFKRRVVEIAEEKLSGCCNHKCRRRMMYEKQEEEAPSLDEKVLVFEGKEEGTERSTVGRGTGSSQTKEVPRSSNL